MFSCLTQLKTTPICCTNISSTIGLMMLTPNSLEPVINGDANEKVATPSARYCGHYLGLVKNFSSYLAAHNPPLLISHFVQAEWRITTFIPPFPERLREQGSTQRD